LFLLPARDAVSVGIANKEINPIGSVSLGLFEDQLLWMHDGAAVAPLEVRSLVLKGFTALMRGSTESPEYVERELEMRNLSQRIVSQQEEVQRRIARDLHDAVIADLTLLKRAVLSEPPVSRDHVSQSLDAVVLKLREICYELSPSDLKDWGLNTTLEALVEQVAARTGANCMLNFVDNIPSLDSFVELHIFRIIQEALNNSAKYSGASQISVTAELKHGWLSFEVRDNGKGFDASQLSGPSKHGGMGRTSMQERVEMIRAVFPTRLDVTSQPGAGTTTTLFIKVRG
jgi:signal transduction histidine kinase